MNRASRTASRRGTTQSSAEFCPTYKRKAGETLKAGRTMRFGLGVYVSDRVSALVRDPEQKRAARHKRVNHGASFSGKGYTTSQARAFSSLSVSSSLKRQISKSFSCIALRCSSTARSSTLSAASRLIAFKMLKGHLGTTVQLSMKSNRIARNAARSSVGDMGRCYQVGACYA